MPRLTAPDTSVASHGMARMKAAVPLYAIKTKAHLGELTFRRRAMANSQARLVGRYALEPEIDLDAFNCRAVVDWLTICFWLGRKTQFQWLQDDIEAVLGRKPFVQPLSEEPGGVADKFDVRIQEPDLRKIRAACDLVGAKYGLEMLPFIRAIEISVDFTPKQPDDGKRAKLFTVLTRHFWTDRDVISGHFDRPRFTWGKNKEETGHVLRHIEGGPEGVNESLLISTVRDRSPFVDSNYYIGAKGSDISWRIMDKVIDTQNHRAGTAIQLDEADKRVRIEVTLDRPAVSAIGLTHLKDLARMRFARLQGMFFTFMLPTFVDVGKVGRSVNSAIKAWHDQQRVAKFLQTGVIGLKAMDDARELQAMHLRKQERRLLVAQGLKMKRPPRVGTQKAGTFLAYDELNGRVSDALRHLGARVAAAFPEE
ncbi:hypothetical protein FJ976_17295 [Mesorhizobium sp. B1-1-9]|uniref:hypothetical protein n=1 Tax=Mesorhizobium sp. B1-1-9 TaxID=2589975 RepID=UPI001128282F|nr:hypothetical protein [Mesorhizobium sp. B1-1-9]TPN49485.1 hypothetical protein FJ976_17295 [Mesorhizobium sp. B1-1-9]